jgi:hypothetical protein
MSPRTVSIRGRRIEAGDIDGILRALVDRVYSVRLWRESDSYGDEWVYLGAFPPAQCDIELIGERFGGGAYRAKIYGRWDPKTRQDPYIPQVEFGLDERAWPVTPETRELIRRYQQS